MKKRIESRIRLNVVLMYLFIATVCGGFIFFFYSLSEQLRGSQITFEEYYTKIALVNNLTQTVNQIQTEANLYVHTQNRQFLDNFHKHMNQVEHSIDSLTSIYYNLPIYSIWQEISDALIVKEQTIIALSEHLTIREEVVAQRERAVNRSIREIREVRTITTTLPTDTIIHITPERQRFWRRVSNVFNPDEPQTETIVLSREGETVITHDEYEIADAYEELLNELFENLRRTQARYNRRINAIREQINILVIADQEISSRISELLIQLNTQVIHSRWAELEKEEAKLQESGQTALHFGIVALIISFIFIILIIIDVNKGYKLRKALEEANRRNREIMESRHKLLLSVAHDVKTPLNSILGYLEIYRQTQKISEKEVVSVQNSGNHIFALMNNLLEFSALEQGKLQLAHDSFSLNDLCDELYDMFAPLAKAKNLSFGIEKDFCQAQMLNSDKLKMKQILTNVLSNAIKYTTAGSVVFKTSYKNKNLQFTVTDTGAGIPKKTLESIYQPFVRAEENNILAEGSGFGMYVVKGLIELFGGNIHYQSKKGKGTKVLIELPASEGSAKSVDQTLKKILIVDDDEAFASMVKNMCINLGHEAIICLNLNCLDKELIAKEGYNLVLTDMEMNEYSGKDVLRKTKEFDEKIPVFLMTGRMDYNTQLAKLEGFDDYISKPISTKNLYLLIGGNLAENNDTQRNIDSFLSEIPDEAQLQVIEEFLFSAVNNVVELREAVNKDDFRKAQAICHKMRPMCIQLNAPKTLTDTMQEIDSFRNSAPENYNWQAQILSLSDGLEEFLSQVQEKYFVEED